MELSVLKPGDNSHVMHMMICSCLSGKDRTACDIHPYLFK